MSRAVLAAAVLLFSSLSVVRAFDSDYSTWITYGVTVTGGDPSPIHSLTPTSSNTDHKLETFIDLYDTSVARWALAQFFRVEASDYKHLKYTFTPGLFNGGVEPIIAEVNANVDPPTTNLINAPDGASIQVQHVDNDDASYKIVIIVLPMEDRTFTSGSVTVSILDEFGSEFFSGNGQSVVTDRMQFVNFDEFSVETDAYVLSSTTITTMEDAYTIFNEGGTTGEHAFQVDDVEFKAEFDTWRLQLNIRDNPSDVRQFDLLLVGDYFSDPNPPAIRIDLDMDAYTVVSTTASPVTDETTQSIEVHFEAGTFPNPTGDMAKVVNVLVRRTGADLIPDFKIRFLQDSTSFSSSYTGTNREFGLAQVIASPFVSSCSVPAEQFAGHSYSCTISSCVVQCPFASSATIDANTPVNVDSLLAIFPDDMVMPQPGKGVMEFSLAMGEFEELAFVFSNTSWAAPAAAEEIPSSIWSGFIVQFNYNGVKFLEASVTGSPVASSSTTPGFVSTTPANFKIVLSSAGVEVYKDGSTVLSHPVVISNEVFVGYFSSQVAPHSIQLTNVEFSLDGALSEVSRTCDYGMWSGAEQCSMDILQPVAAVGVGIDGYEPFPNKVTARFYGEIDAAYARAGTPVSLHALRGSDHPLVFGASLMSSEMVQGTTKSLGHSQLSFLFPDDLELDPSTDYEFKIDGGSTFASLGYGTLYGYDMISVNYAFTTPTLETCANRMTSRRRFTDHSEDLTDVPFGNKFGFPSSMFFQTFCQYVNGGAWTLLAYGDTALADVLGVSAAPISSLRDTRSAIEPFFAPFSAYAFAGARDHDPERKEISDYDVAYALLNPYGGRHSQTPLSLRTGAGDEACANPGWHKAQISCLLPDGCPFEGATHGYTQGTVMDVDNSFSMGFFIPADSSQEGNCDWRPTASDTVNSALYFSVTHDRDSILTTPSNGTTIIAQTAVYGFTDIPRSTCKAILDRSLHYDTEGHSDLGHYMQLNPHVYLDDTSGEYKLKDGVYVLRHAPEHWNVADGAIDTQLRTCDMTTDNGGWQRFWWFNHDGYDIFDALEHQEGDCTYSFGPSCGGRMPTNLDIGRTSLLVKEPASGRAVKYRFEKGNRLCEAVFDSLVHGTEYNETYDFQGATWSPVEVSPGDGSGMDLSLLPAAGSWMYRTQNGFKSFLLDDSRCSNENIHFGAGETMCNGGSGSGSGSGVFQPFSIASLLGVTPMELYFREEEDISVSPSRLHIDTSTGAITASSETSYVFTMNTAPKADVTVMIGMETYGLDVTLSTSSFVVTPSDYHLPRRVYIESSSPPSQPVVLTVNHTYVAMDPTDVYTWLEPTEVTLVFGDPYSTHSANTEVSLEETFHLELQPASLPGRPRVFGAVQVVRDHDGSVVEGMNGAFSLSNPTDKVAVVGLNYIEVLPGSASDRIGNFDLEGSMDMLREDGLTDLMVLSPSPFNLQCGPSGFVGATPQTMTVEVTLNGVTKTEADDVSNIDLCVEAVRLYTGVSLVSVTSTEELGAEQIKYTLDVNHNYEFIDADKEVHMAIKIDRVPAGGLDNDRFLAACQNVGTSLHRLLGAGCFGNV